MRSYESQDDLGVSISVMVVLSLVFLSLSNGMFVVEGGLFPFFPNDFFQFCVMLIFLLIYL
jgi:hypothetical protein